MHRWGPVHESAVAPSPIVPTYRPDHQCKRRIPSMPTSIPDSPTNTGFRGPSGPRPQARSAGMAERPSRNENLSDLVSFFQTQNMPTPTSTAPIGSPESTTALPIVVSPEPKDSTPEMTKEQLKPLHRRLLQFTQRQKKESTPKTKVDDHQKQIEALQREGYLMSSKPPKSTSSRSKNSMDSSKNSSKTSLDRPKSSLERTFSKSKMQDIEAIGRPWLNRSDSTRSSSEPKRRLASLDLDDFGSMLDVAVSLSEYEPSPPPYQRSTPSALASRITEISPSQSSLTLPMPRSSSEARSHSIDRPRSSTTSIVETQGSGSKDDDLPQPSISTSSSLEVVDQNQTPKSRPTSDSSPSVAISDQSQNSELEQVQAIEQPQAPDHSPPNPPTNNPSPPSLKLFPNVAPPRMSSKNAWRLSATPQYQTTTTRTAPPVKAEVQTAPKKIQDVSEKQQKQQQQQKRTETPSKDSEEPTCSGALGTAITTDSTPNEVRKTSNVSVQSQKKSRPPSLALGTLKAFPLPAPTRPLPSIPKSNNLAPPVDPRAHTAVRTSRPSSKMSNIQYSQPSPIAEEPREPEPRPATSLGQINAGQPAEDEDDAMSLQTTPERPKSTSPEQYTPRRRSLSVGIPHMKEVPESPSRNGGQHTTHQPLADSPVLGHLPLEKPNEKRATRKGLQINPQVDRKNLPFGLPSPPPSAALPPDPATQQPSERVERVAHRNYTAPVGTGLNISKGVDMPFGAPNHRASIISRSNSSRSSLRHESIPESSYEDSSRAESPLPSSDDEGFGPNTAKKRLHIYDESLKPHPKQRSHPMHRGYETVDGRTSHGRPSYPHPARSLTPQGRRNHGFENSFSPQSQYSQSTMRSRDSQSNHHVSASARDANHFLEDRVANLERQNQILQAALMAALNAGVKPNIDLHESAIPSNFPGSGPGNPYQGRFASRPDSWMSSSRSSDLSGFETPGSVRDARANARQLDNMLEDIEAGWLSDKSSVGGPRSMGRQR
ncbi:hypothetical protein N7478_010784 [Penicillium angulare]|uniref:uncharacterized protein n=1 Tax=Penicillium angulare TaxID=116970 RepID=UPI00254200D1|nr:uncharacterized protein N7478_010784 [Penicillium angulare]KAJ5263179.1 hypothetical protein N7478_010784 [Penicillium angulare]